MSNNETIKMCMKYTVPALYPLLWSSGGLSFSAWLFWLVLYNVQSDEYVIELVK